MLFRSLALMRPTNLLLAVAMLATFAVLALRAFFVPASARAAVARPEESEASRRDDESSASLAMRAAWFAAGIGIGLAPLALLQWSRFGSPLASGYDEHLARVVPFSLEFALSRPGVRGTEPNLPYYLRTLAGLGWGTLYAWPIGVHR